jgi:phosphoribosylformylglycinamidine (FGAM) synthase-like amidotransferase family enzyme
MEERPRALLLKFPGTNCDAETARALESVGFATEIAPISTVTRATLDGIRLVVFSGGFSYGDYVMSGRIASLVTEQKIAGVLKEFRDAGGYLLGICNGFVNGSFAGIAGLQDETGRVFGLMPHPERFMGARDHYDPDWNGSGNEKGSGYFLFQSLYEAVTNNETATA